MLDLTPSEETWAGDPAAWHEAAWRGVGADGSILRVRSWGDGAASRPVRLLVSVESVPAFGHIDVPPPRYPTLEEIGEAVRVVGPEGAVFEIPSLFFGSGVPPLAAAHPETGVMLSQVGAAEGSPAALRLSLTSPILTPADS